jgi:molybdopterin-guanine dinucleotide biosynthesis protein
MKRPAIIAVSGFSSEVGKTTLMCDLLRAFPGWEAIKVTRGHYRSCGRDPHACCVSDLLSDEPVVRSGRDQNYAPGKDTGRFWDAGASNVHWVIVTDAQVEQGIREALARVTAPGVFIEGNSILDFIQGDFALMVSRASGEQIKGSARRAISHASAIYLSNFTEAQTDERASFTLWMEKAGLKKLVKNLPTYTRGDLPELVAQLRLLYLSEHLETSTKAEPVCKTTFRLYDDAQI